MNSKVRSVLLALAPILSIAAAPAWDPSRWLLDLDQFRSAIEHDYPNLEWLSAQPEVSLDAWFSRTATEIRESRNDADARRALDKLAVRFHDGHLSLLWPSPPDRENKHVEKQAIAGQAITVASFCHGQGYDAGQVTVGTAVSIPGYRSIDAGGPFSAGLVVAPGKKVGILRIGVFSPQGYPVLCARAVANSGTPIDKPCDEPCSDRVLTEAYALMTRGLIASVERLHTAGAEVLLLDLTANGGGTEWTEAAARIVSPVPLRSAALRVMPNEAWVSRWHALATELRAAARKAPGADRSMLLGLARDADALSDGSRPCGSGVSCPRLTPAGYASGLIAELPAHRLGGRAWSAAVFSPSQFPYRDSVWKGPVIVLVDSETWSAAEQFSALLQDNGAAVVMGSRTGGAGCGHLYGNNPITLAYSGAKLELPNCARLRKDGSNEVAGVLPDVSTGVRPNDAPAYAGQLTGSHLTEAVRRAETLIQERRRDRRSSSASGR